MRAREAIGTIIRELRHEREMSLRTLSEKSSVALGYVSEIERGVKEASSEILSSLAFGLEVETGQILIEAGYRMAGINSFEISENELDKLVKLH